MSINNSSIFNEVFGPVMIGPSSSHTAGPARIGLMTRLMLSESPQAVKIIFDRHGAYPNTYRGQGSDYGFLGGLLGMETDDFHLMEAPALARERGMVYEFIIDDLPDAWHPNCVRIQARAADGRELTVDAASTGGGTFVIAGYNGCKVSISGGLHEFLLETDAPDRDRNLAAEILRQTGLDFDISAKPGSGDSFSLLNIKTDQKPAGLAEKLKAALGPIIYLRPVMPVVKRLASREPFVNAAEALQYAAHNGLKETWRLAALYESSLSGQTADDILDLADRFAVAMRFSAQKALDGDYAGRGFIGPQLPGVQRQITEGSAPQVDLGTLNRAVLWACGIMDYGLCGGLVVAAPTGGSSGVLPGTVISVGEELGKSAVEINKALLVGGLIGVFIHHQATFSAETAACQAEIGSASAMAAGAVVELLNGTPQQSFQAAALALINLLGLICDPVCGIGNIPCVNRNAIGVANALTSANLVMAGFDPCIPLDEVIQAMMSVGRQLPADLRCTGRGGLCATPTAKKLKDLMKI